ncbi:hypothetical protein BDY21DRAFT_68203 [Lineolata rhizophorae]|uniref:Uncharacterized protein n=1 Tax=Lineolata rhizophorae TaxID=578093 RepID=A0A6A6NV40_9PEZI|nr:hypothetical protein BDY21DRAFT_68203 [Lineolata rhizophorae]
MEFACFAYVGFALFLSIPLQLFEVCPFFFPSMLLFPLWSCMSANSVHVVRTKKNILIQFMLSVKQTS